jgi:hypothetical protein
MDTAKRSKSPKPKPSTVRPPAAKPRVAAASPRKPTPRALPSVPPTPEEIARRAYEIYMGRGGEAGDAAQDWLQAERELAPPPAAPKPRRRLSANA